MRTSILILSLLGFIDSNWVPSPISSVQVFQMDDRALYIKWNRPIDKTKSLQGYSVQYSKMLSDEIGPELPGLTVEDPADLQAKLILDRFSRNRIYVYAIYEGGVSEPVFVDHRLGEIGIKQPGTPEMELRAHQRNVKVIFKPSLIRLGAYFYVKHRRVGERNFVARPRVQELEDSLEGCEVGHVYEIVVVAVDGQFETSSKPVSFYFKDEDNLVTF